MDGMNDHERAIAWLWAIEALASFKQVDASLLHDLIALAPPLPDDMGNNAKERVALKSLESLFKFDSCNVTSGDVPSSAQRSKIGFNLSETCQNVLKRIVNETPESDLRTGGPGLLKWDIQPFIMHKGASLPKCALKQLKDSILDGTHLHADVLRKKGGLTLRNDGNRVLLRDSNPRLNESGSNAQNMGVKGIADPLIIEHENKLLEEPSNANLFPSKRHRISSDAENMEDDNRSSANDSDDWNIKSKKMKRDASYVSESTEQNQIPLHGKKQLEDLSERESCDLAENQMGMMEEGAVLEDCIDIYTSSKRCGQSSGNAILKSQSENHLNATSMPQDKFVDEAHQNLCIDQAKDDGGIHPEPITSSVAPPDGTQQKVSAKVATCNNEHESHIKASPPVSTEGPQNKSISESGNGLVMENLADENHNCVIGCDDRCVITRKMKWDPSYVLWSIEKNQIPLHVRELLEDSSERDVPLPERERCDLAENQMGTMDKGKVIEDGHDDHTTSKRCGQSTDPAVNKIQTENPCNAGSLPQDTFQDEVPKYTYNDEAEDDDGGRHPEQRASFVAAPDETLHKISTEVFNRNSEHDFHVEVSLPASTDESQQKSIANEGKGDEHCPEPRTLGVASLDETQNDSNSECDSHVKVAHPASDEESQQKSIANEARELLDWLCHYESETMTDSVEFHDEKIDAVMKKHALLSSQSTSSQYSETTKNVCKKPNEGGLLICDTSNCPVVVHENWLRSSDILYEKDNFKCPFCSYSLALTEYLDSKKRASMLKKDLDAFIHTLEHQPKESLGSEHNKENICMRKFHEDLNAKTKNHQNGHLGKSVEHLGKQCEERANQVNDPQLQNIIGTEQQVAPSGSCIPNNSECRDESVTLVGINQDVSTGEKIWKEKVIQKCIAVVGLDGCQNQGLDGCQNQVPTKGDTLSVKNTVSLLVDQRQAVVSEKGGLQQHINYAPREQGHALNVDSEQAGAQKSSTSNYNTRLRKKIPYTSPPISQLRRVKVPWSVEEEEMLKKGVQTFSRIDERTLPWKQILEFGGSVFLHSRTPGDLKDKWRNICRRRPKSN